MSGDVSQGNTIEELINKIGTSALIVMFVFILAIAILVIVAMWKIFQKAGEPGWKAIIPFYNSYTMYKIVWGTKFFWINFGIGVLTGIINFLPPLAFLRYMSSIAGFVIEVMLLNKLAKSFGHGTGFTIGLIFLPYVFLLILGFGSDEFIRVD